PRRGGLLWTRQLRGRAFCAAPRPGPSCARPRLRTPSCARPSPESWLWFRLFCLSPSFPLRRLLRRKSPAMLSRPVRQAALARRCLWNPSQHGQCVGIEALGGGQSYDSRRQPLEAGAIDFDDTGSLDEVIDTERRCEARRAAGGKHVVRPGRVVAYGFGGHRSHENRTRVVQLRDQAFRPAREHFEVLGRNLVGDLAGTLEALDDEDRSETLERAGRDRRPRELAALALDRAR